ncbi:MAG: NAD(P)/FAD-dependent oxidoreductase, partial [Thermoguttaceae bacterium]|nr:NAD(P)/FAD-dependent oxidoreductase [Thermoguttaceae bacterium]
MFQTHVLRDPAASDLTRAERRRLIELLVRFPFTVRRLAGWHKAMTTAGGVDLREMNRKTMQSRLIPGLFFA